MTSILRKPDQEGQFKSPILSTPRGVLHLEHGLKRWADLARDVHFELVD